jgi:transcription-repair coupling factor (superfamily II helicase)
VRQKDAIKALRAEVDILTLTATPIPRTLNMALGGLRDLSIIATPPARRLSIKTFRAREHDAALIKEAVLRETLRGGQVFYVHNEVRTIEQRAAQLRELLPELSIAVAHGQMHETQLERVMSDFYHQRHHILLCSTIIETGIDIPNANTIIIDRADKFGSPSCTSCAAASAARTTRPMPTCCARPASAHDRGRAQAPRSDRGRRRSRRRLPAGHARPRDPRRRRTARRRAERPDPERRLQPLLAAAAQRRRGPARGDIPDVDAPLEPSRRSTCTPGPDSRGLPARSNMRLILYKRIAACESDEALREMQVEMIDRFGLLPEVKRLFTVASLRLLAKRCGMRNAGTRGAGGTSSSLRKDHGSTRCSW